MENWIKKKDYAILIYSQENRDCYNAAMKALNQTKKAAGWDRIQGVTILKDCRIPDIYHGDDLAIIMERDNGSGKYEIKIMDYRAGGSSRPIRKGRRKWQEGIKGLYLRTGSRSKQCLTAE